MSKFSNMVLSTSSCCSVLPNLQHPVQSKKPARHWIWVRWLSEARPSKLPASHKLLSLGKACNGVRFRDPQSELKVHVSRLEKLPSSCIEQAVLASQILTTFNGDRMEVRAPKTTSTVGLAQFASKTSKQSLLCCNQASKLGRELMGKALGRDSRFRKSGWAAKTSLNCLHTNLSW